MSYTAYFDAQDVKETSLAGEVYIRKNVLHFHLKVPSIADKNAQGYEFDGVATDEHTKQYAVEFKKFMRDGNKIVSRALQVVYPEPKEEMEALPEPEPEPEPKEPKKLEVKHAARARHS